ncbi:MAG: S1 RNA-binding domain-containing protein [Ignavibacteria bacterium]|nr:S1 RNA-binding domain-containing protein [Ignavibacteria bacterium]
MTDTTGALEHSSDEQINTGSTPSEPVTTNTDSSAVTPVEPTEVTPVESSAITPAEPSEVSPVESTAITPAESTEVTPAEPTAITPAEPTAITPAEPTAEKPDEPAAGLPDEPAPKSEAEPPVERLGAVSIIVETEADVRRKEEERRKRDEDRRKRDEAYEVLRGFQENGTDFEIEITERVKGGLRGIFNGLRVFVPMSHFSVKKTPPESELASAVGKTLRVKVQELQSDDTGYKSAVVSHRDYLVQNFWDSIEVGSVHEGVVASVTQYGAFVNLGDFEGLVHISRLSKSRVENPSAVVKKGEKIKVTVIEVDKKNQKLSLSHKEHEADPWPDVEKKFPVGSTQKGKVRRLADFGAYVQVGPRIEGLVRLGDMSWTQRIKHPSEVLSVGQQIDVQILSVNAAKGQLALGYKQTQENPWLTISEKLSVGAVKTGIVKQVSMQGAIIRIEDTFDGFMPRSKMANAGQGKKVALNPGDQVECVVIDINTESASIILAMKEAEMARERPEESDRRGARHGGRHTGHRSAQQAEHSASQSTQSGSSGVTLADMLREADKSKLKG